MANLIDDYNSYIRKRQALDNMRYQFNNNLQNPGYSLNLSMPGTNANNFEQPEFSNLDMRRLMTQAAGTGTTAATGAAAKGGKLAGLFGSLKGKFSGLNNISIRNLLKNGQIGDPELLGWDSKNGLSLLGGRVGKLYAGGRALADTFGTLQNYSRMANIDKDAGDIKSEILASAASNPLASQYLTQDEISLLNKIKRGNYNPEGTGFGSQMGAIGMGALKGGLTGLVAGSTPGAILGALGGAFKSGSEARINSKSQSNERLEALLQSLNDASAQYKSMRRPNFTGLGIQGKYRDMFR